MGPNLLSRVSQGLRDTSFWPWESRPVVVGPRGRCLLLVGAVGEQLIVVGAVGDEDISDVGEDGAEEEGEEEGCPGLF